MLRRLLKKLCMQCGDSEKADGTPATDAALVTQQSSLARECTPLSPQVSPEPASVHDESVTEVSVNKALPYHGYRPTQHSTVRRLPVHYWFYVYVYSSESDSLLAPFLELCQDDFCKDRRLLSIMNRCQVSLCLGSIEMYKALPRHIVNVRGVSWRAVVQAVVELEDAFPKLMRFATHPLLMDASTCRFASTQFHRTALQTRQTRQ